LAPVAIHDWIFRCSFGAGDNFFVDCRVGAGIELLPFASFHGLIVAQRWLSLSAGANGKSSWADFWPYREHPAGKVRNLIDFTCFCSRVRLVFEIRS